MLTFSVDLPPAGASDVTTRELSVKVGESDAVIRTLAGSDVEAGGFEGEQDTEVFLSLIDVDDKGNRSEPREQTATLFDNLAPPQPGQLGIRVTAET